MKTKYFFHTSFLGLIFFLNSCSFFSDNNSIKNYNEINYNDKKLSLSGNATIKLFPTDSNKISFKILNKDSYLINYKENNISIFEDINEMKSNIKYPTVYFYIPRSYMNYEVELNKNGDIIFSEDFAFNSLNITLNGNGDFSNTNKMKISNFNIVLNGNGDVKINNIISDKINCILNDNGDIFLKGSTNYFKTNNKNYTNIENLLIQNK